MRARPSRRRRRDAVGGEACLAAEVSRGAWLRAGNTDFSVHFEDHVPPPRTRDADPGPLYAVVDAAPGPLYAVVDAACDDRILALPRQSASAYRSLYDGVAGETLAEAAP